MRTSAPTRSSSTPSLQLAPRESCWLGLAEVVRRQRWDVRCAAALALGALGPPARPLLLARRTVERDPLVQGALASALALGGG